MKIDNVNFRKSVVLWANSGGDVTSEYDVDQNMKVLLKKIMRMRCRDLNQCIGDRGGGISIYNSIDRSAIYEK